MWRWFIFFYCMKHWFWVGEYPYPSFIKFLTGRLSIWLAIQFSCWMKSQRICSTQGTTPEYTCQTLSVASPCLKSNQYKHVGTLQIACQSLPEPTCHKVEGLSCFVSSPKPAIMAGGCHNHGDTGLATGLSFRCRFGYICSNRANDIWMLVYSCSIWWLFGWMNELCHILYVP